MSDYTQGYKDAMLKMQENMEIALANKHVDAIPAGMALKLFIQTIKDIVEDME